LKEADWLAARGHDVTVVTKRVDAWSDARDDDLLRGRAWTAARVNLLRADPRGRPRWLATAVRAEVAQRVHRLTRIARCGEAAYYRGFVEVLRLAKATHADCYIAHTQGALPIAARAAAATGVPFGFDCEDLLAEEAADGLQDPWKREVIKEIEGAYLPRAAYVTATSHAMADYLEATYAIRPPRVVRNVFPRAELAGVPSPRERRPRETLELVWMSATIGEGRGLDQAFDALTRLPEQVRLTLYGRVLPAYEPVLRGRLQQLGIEARVTIRPIQAPAAIMSAIAMYDIGLTLDGNDCLNRSLTICNKVFLYLQAGVVVGATDTAGQREVVDSVPAAGFLCPPGDGAALAAKLARFVDDRRALVAAQDAAWHAGQQRYNWDRDALVFQSALDDTLANGLEREREDPHPLGEVAVR
jgi:glycosyltransferase involved in cell wall biosynthesis